MHRLAIFARLTCVFIEEYLTLPKLRLSECHDARIDGRAEAASPKANIALSGEGRLRLGIAGASLALHSACTALPR